MATKRLTSDLKKLHADPPPGVSVDISNGNILEWDAIILGPYDTPFENGTFRLRLKFPQDYPSNPPVVHFHSRIFHPNVFSDGEICLDILQDKSKWKETYDASAVLCAIQALLGDPNPNSPANNRANDLFRNNKAAYDEEVKKFVKMTENESASGNLNQEFEKLDWTFETLQMDDPDSEEVF